MNRVDKDTAIKTFNELGQKRKPFFFLIDFEMENIIIETHKSDNILFDFSARVPQSLPSYSWASHPLSFDSYASKYDQMMAHINLGNTFLINLTCPTPISTSLSLQEIYTSTQARYKVLLRDEFVVFSPETFVKVKDGYIYTYPMKGTIDAAIPHALDIIMNDQKELAEHYTIVDLLRNDLSIVAKEVELTRFRYPEYIDSHSKTLIQTSSEIRGRLATNFHQQLGELIFSLLPAGSISGAPKKKTVEIIQEVEGEKRGYYTGICGYFDGYDLDSGVMIRYIENTESGLRYRSGCGITYMSEAQVEYREMIDKVYLPSSQKSYIDSSVSQTVAI